jgi:hypothetical protein
MNLKYLKKQLKYLRYHLSQKLLRFYLYLKYLR